MVSQLDREGLLTEICSKQLPASPRKFVQARRRYLELQLLYQQVSDVALDGLSPEVADGSGGSAAVTGEPLQRLLRSAETREMLRKIPTTGDGFCAAPLGLDVGKWETLEHSVAEIHCPDELRRMLLDEVERRLEGRCATLARTFHSPAHLTAKPGGAGSRLDASKARGLPGIIRERRAATAEKCAEAARLKIETACRFQSYLQKWSSALRTLWTLVATHKCDLEPESHAAFLNCFGAIVENAHLKLRCLNAELLLGISEGSEAEDLRKTRQSLDDLKSSLEERSAAADAQLVQYAHVGDDFSRIVRVYSNVMRDIAIVQDDIRRITAS
ncbi:hypothetical protein HKX48_005699 [Thoreauomyces humboldtii]|nr:hypothetical protein HKX48_005699 [Thoreauomyces humboldtii]